MMKVRQGLRRRRGSRLLIALIGLATYAALLAMLFAVFTPERYDLVAGQVSPITVTASKDVVDSVTTQQMIDEAVAAVPVNYTLDETVQPAVLESLRGDFDALNQIRGWDLGSDGAVDAATLTRARQMLLGADLTAEDIALIRGLSDDDFNTLESDVIAIADELLTAKIAQGGEDEAVSKLERELTARETYSAELVDLCSRVASSVMQANMLLDEATTETNRQKAIDSVEPIVYLKGRNIVKSGEIITRAQIAMLDSLGMLAGNHSIDVLMYVGVGLLVLLLLSTIVVYLAIYERDMLKDAGRMALLAVIMLTTCGLSTLVQALNPFLMPVAIGVMLTAALLRTRLALVVNVVLAVLCGIISSGVSGSLSSSMIIVMIAGVISGSLCVAVIHGKTQRVFMLLAGLLACAVNVLTTLALGLITEVDTGKVLVWAAWSGGSGILSGVLSIGIQPALEWIFNLVTPAKLMELSNPNHPLIRRMILEASGTYHHSIIVANLAEAAADAIGANGLLARVGAYYHDVGKLKRPLYFKENQIGDNPHDRTDPLVSAAILTAHPTDGVLLAEKYRMPQPILDIIAQHHGDTPVMYFYGRCVEQNGAENVDIDDFRYPGPKPQTKEAAIVMLADTIEAAARTASDRSAEGLEKLIRKLIRGKMDDGQLNDAPITLKDVERATRAFVTVLGGVFHQRIEYPDLVIPPKKHSKALAASAEEGEKQNA